MSSAPPSATARSVFTGLGVALVYLAGAKAGLALAVQAEQVSVVWPPTGIALAAVVLFGWRAVPGILAGAFAANAMAGEPLWVAAGIAAGNTLEALAGAALLTRLRFEASLARVRDVLTLLAAVVLAPGVSATIGVGFLVAGGVQLLASAPTLWQVWFLGDALGGLILAPCILVWLRGDRSWRAHGWLEPALMLGGIVAVAVVVFSVPPAFPVAYMVYPFLIWAAVRLGPAYTTLATLLVNAIAIAGTLSGHGAFGGGGSERGLVLVQMYVAVGATTALILAAMAAQARQAHERADLSEHRLRMAMAGARVGVWDWNIATGELHWSEALEPLHGLPRGGFNGTYEAFRERIHPQDVERVEALINRSVETRAPYEAEFRLLGADGIVRWTGARGTVIEDSHGRPVRMIGVGIDVTEFKQMEEELRLQHRRKDEFLAMLGHELRNPLAAIVHAVDLLSSGIPADREHAGRVIRRQSRSLSRLVDDLLDVSRITRGLVRLDRKRLLLAEVVNSGAEVWTHLLAQKRLRLTMEAGKDAWVEGDSTRLTQVFANLVHNAAKFTPEGGAISIVLGEENGSAVVYVRDDGQGMTSDVVAHAFELFVQGATLLDRHQGGLGLGLTLVRQLVEMHGGTVEAKSAGPGRGSEIIVRLPLALRSETGAPAPGAPTAVVPAPTRRVLVVEDNPDVRDMLVFLLKREGHDVRAASDGQAALLATESFVPEVVLLDLGLPGLDGYSVARKLRASPGTADSLLVALTGYGQAEDREQAYAAGFDHHLLKPAEPAHVLEVMRMSRAATRTE